MGHCTILSWEKASGKNKFGVTVLWDLGTEISTTECQVYPSMSFLGFVFGLLVWFFYKQLKIINSSNTAWQDPKSNLLDKRRYQWRVFIGSAFVSIHPVTWNKKSGFLSYVLFLFLELNERKKPTHRKEHGQTLAQVQLEDISVLSSIRSI